MILLEEILIAKKAKKVNLFSQTTSENGFLDEIIINGIKLSNGTTIAWESTKQLLNKSYTNDLMTQLEIET